MSDSGIYTPGFEFASGFDSLLKTYLLFISFGSVAEWLNFFCHSVPHFEFQNGGGFSPAVAAHRRGPKARKPRALIARVVAPHFRRVLFSKTPGSFVASALSL